MVRSAWAMPMTLVQKFEANEAVASCLQVACESDIEGYWHGTIPIGWALRGDTNHPKELDGENPWGRDEDLRDWAHHNHGCKTPGGSGVIISDSGEISFASGYTYAYHSDEDGDGLADLGERIYWCEDAKGGLLTYKFNHWGTVTQGNRS